MMFLGPMMVGVGIGMLFDQVAAGAAIGLGVGFMLQEMINRGMFRKNRQRVDQ